MEVQGYTAGKNVLYQDNKFVILIAKNSCMSAGKFSKHMKNKSFLITDETTQDKLIVQQRDTELIWDGGNTKPPQGNRFPLFRSILMGIPPDFDNSVESKNTQPLLLPKVDAVGLISKQDIYVLKHATGSTDNQEHKKGVKSKSTQLAERE